MCDAATYLRLGKVVGHCIPRETTARDMAEMMVGKVLTTPKRASATPGEVVLRLNELTLPSPSAFGMPLRRISLDLRKREILGIGGVAGNGQDELLAALSGELRSPENMLRYKERDIGQAGPAAFSTGSRRDALPNGSLSALMYVLLARRMLRDRCLAGTCKNLSSDAKYFSALMFWSSISQRGVAMHLLLQRSDRLCWILPQRARQSS